MVRLPRPTRCTCATSSAATPEPVTVATEIQTQLEQNLGIKTEIDIRDENTYLTEANRGEPEDPSAGAPITRT